MHEIFARISRFVYWYKLKLKSLIRVEWWELGRHQFLEHSSEAFPWLPWGLDLIVLLDQSHGAMRIFFGANDFCREACESIRLKNYIFMYRQTKLFSNCTKHTAIKKYAYQIYTILCPSPLQRYSHRIKISNRRATQRCNASSFLMQKYVVYWPEGGAEKMSLTG
jgi:hypothetical protein